MPFACWGQAPNGHRFSLEQGAVRAYRRELNLKNGLLNRVIRWATPDGMLWDLEFQRFVSLWQYYLATGDKDFMEKYGYEIMLDTARFWSSRLEWSDEDGMYHINDVIGADEYKEHCNDNSLTNYLAKWNMEQAMSCCETLKAEQPEFKVKRQFSGMMGRSLHRHLP